MKAPRVLVSMECTEGARWCFWRDTELQQRNILIGIPQEEIMVFSVGCQV